MSTHDEDRLTRSLHDRAHEVSGSPLALADVQRRARGIQRRRRAAGGLVAAVLVAVAVPVALNVSGTPGAERQVAPASTAPSESPSATPATATPTPRAPTPTSTPTAAGPTAPTPTHQAVVADTTPLTVQGAPAGAPARVTYLKGGTVVVPGAAPADLPGGTAETVAPYRGGWLAVQRRQGTSYVVHIDASGRVTGSQPGGDRIVTSDDGVEVSWVEGGKAYLDTTNGHSDQAQSIDLPTGSDAYPVGFVGPGSVVGRDHRPAAAVLGDRLRDPPGREGACSRCGRPPSPPARSGWRRPTTAAPAPRAGRSAPTPAATPRPPATGR